MSTSDRATAIAEELVKQGVRTVVLAGSDTHGVMRGKRIPIQHLGGALEHGIALCDVFWVMHIDESAVVPRPAGHTGYFPTEREGYPDIVAVPDLDTVRIMPWHDATALLVCDWHLPDGRGPVPIAPRGVLRSVVDRAEQMGYLSYTALELEFYLLHEATGTSHRKRSDELVPLQDRSSTYGVVLGSHQEGIGALIRERTVEYGLPIEACNPETGPGQFEINLRYARSVDAADHAFLFKSAVKELAAQNDLLATFMAKPNSQWAGNSCHVHTSLRRPDDEGVFFDADDQHGVSAEMRHFVGGVLATMGELTALMAPTPNAYRRYSPYSWAGTSATWGIDNRSAGLRAIIDGPLGTRIEHRQPGGDVNPYIAAAVTLAAGLYGLEQAIEPTDLVKDDVYALPAGAVPGLPRTLEQALYALEGSKMARDWLGADFVEHYIAMKEAELEAQSRAVTDWEVARYLEAL